MRISPRVSLARFTLGCAVIAVWSVAMFYVGGLDNTAAAIVAAALFTVSLCSLGEWLVHGVLYHNRIPGLAFIRDIHHKGHHFALFPPKHYVQTSGYEFMRFRKPYQPWRMSDNRIDNELTKWSQVALHFVAGIPLILIPSWLATHSVAFLVSAFITLSIISWLLAYVHGVIHTPGTRWIEYQRWYQWLDRHHYIHHIDLTANMNFMMPLCDVLFGTLKLRLTEREAAKFPSFEAAKPMAKDIPPAAQPELARL